MRLKQLSLLALLLIALLVAGCSGNVPASGLPVNDSGKTVDKQPVQGNQAPDMMKLTVYYAKKDALHLVAQVHEVPKNSHPAQTALELLSVAPSSGDLVSALPQGTKVRGISVKDHVAVVDFSDAIIKNNPGGSATEALLVGAVVNTLTEFSDIHKVKILVEGKKVETLTGHMDVSEPLSRSEKIIKK